MWLFRRKERTAAPRWPTARGRAIDGDDDELRAEIERLTAANRAQPRPRDRAAAAAAAPPRRHPRARRRRRRAPSFAGARRRSACPAGDALPEFAARRRSRPGCCAPASCATAACSSAVWSIATRRCEFAEQIDRASPSASALDARRAAAEGYYEEFEPAAAVPSRATARDWIQEGGGVLAADSPLLRVRDARAVPSGRAARAGERLPRRAGADLRAEDDPAQGRARVPGAWHQDGTFMGDVRALNLWLSLSRCGDEAPGLDIVPRRLDQLVADADRRGGARHPGVAGARPRRPRATRRSSGRSSSPATRCSSTRCSCTRPASDPAMPNPRFAIESWFFGGSAFPGEYAPVGALVTARPVLARPRALGRVAGALGRARAAVPGRRRRSLGGRDRRVRRRPDARARGVGGAARRARVAAIDPRRSPTSRRSRASVELELIRDQPRGAAARSRCPTR